MIRLRIYGLDGTVVFSDDGSDVGARPTDDRAFGQALKGRTHAGIVADPDGGPGEVIRVFQPIFAHASGRSTGVLEVHLPYEAIAESVRAETHRTYQLIAFGLGALYLLLAVIAWSTTRALRLHAARREHEALHDPLTGLANRKLFRRRAADAVERSRRGEQGAVVLVDLDRFKEINDTLGHHAGDELLRVIGQRLTESLRTDDTVARLGGDEFGLVLPRTTSESVVRELLTKVHQRMSEEFMLGSVPLAVEGSFGVALYPIHGEDVETLLQNADAAMYHAKRTRSGIAVYEAGATPQASHRLLLFVQLEERVAESLFEMVDVMAGGQGGRGVICSRSGHFPR